MGNRVEPKVFLLGYPSVDRQGLKDYLQYTDQMGFWDDFVQATEKEGISDGEALCSFYAKLCYKSLTVGKNSNITRVRDIENNLRGAHNSGHGSIFEHAWINFVITDCSRVFTHELVRHRVGTAFSQTSGRYCRLDDIPLVWDPILEGCEDIADGVIQKIEDAVYLIECRKGLRKPNPLWPDANMEQCLSPDWKEYFVAEGTTGARDDLRWVPDNSFDFDRKKKITSAIRRIAPNGQSNEMGFSVNIRAIRQLMQVRTAGFAEWEIRHVWNQIYQLTNSKFPTLYHGAKTREVEGLLEVYGMKTQPYELPAGDPAGLRFYAISDIQAELARR